QFAQVDRGSADLFGGVPFRGGCTLVASSNGAFRYLITKPMRGAAGDPKRREAGEARFRAQAAYVEACDMASAMTPYATRKERETRMLELMNFASLHGG